MEDSEPLMLLDQATNVWISLECIQWLNVLESSIDSKHALQLMFPTAALSKLKKIMNKKRLARRTVHTSREFPIIVHTLHAAKIEGTDLCCTDTQMIPHCTVMFCMLEFEIRSVKDFHLINTIFRACDEAVESSGMFKYQHVSSGNLHNFVGKSY